jgi:hypothetical protein
MTPDQQLPVGAALLTCQPRRRSLRAPTFMLICVPLIGLGVAGTGAVHGAEFWTTNTTVTHIYPAAGGFVFLTAYSNTVSLCDQGRRWSIPSSAPNYKAQVASLLLTFSQGLPITLHVIDQSPTCEPVVDRFIVQR